MEASKRSETLISPVGTLVYPYLTRPDVKHKPDGEFHTRLAIAPEECAEFKEMLDAAFENHVQAVREERERMKIKKPLKVAEPPYRINEETGNYEFNFRMKAQGVAKKTGKHFSFKPVLVDCKLNPVPEGVMIFGGTVAKVSFYISPFESPAVGVGLSLRLRGVQILKLVSKKKEVGFAPEEGEEIDYSDLAVARDAEATTEGEDSSTTTNDDDEAGDGVIPF
jgi:hypothetical protein